MYRWRPAEILKVEGGNRNRLLVHYSGWADSFDHWVDLEEESHKLAPEKLLSKDQCNRGGELTEEQIIFTRDYFMQGKEYPPFVELAVPTAPVETTQTNTDLSTEELPAKKPEIATPVAPVSVSLSNSNSLPAPVVAKRCTAGSSLLRPPGDDAESISGASIVSNVAIPKMPTSPPQMPPQQQQQLQQFEQQRLAPPSSASKKILAPVRLVAPTEPNRRFYSQGDQLEVLDIFFKKGANKPSQKWRPAEIIEVVGEYVTIHYDNWDDKYNERLHVANDAHRLGPLLGSRSSRSSHSIGGDSRRDKDKASYPSNGSVHSGGSGENGHSRSNESMYRNHVRNESDGSTSSGHHHLPAAVPSTSSRATPVSAPAPVLVPPTSLMRPPPASSQVTTVPQQAPTPSTVGKSNPPQDQGSELDQANNNNKASAATPSSFDRRSLPLEGKPPALSLAVSSTDPTSPDAEQLTPEQRNFTRNFFNYKKKKRAEQQAAMSTISEDGPAEETKKKDLAESPRNSVLKGLPKMSFGGIFGASKDSLASKSGSPRSLGFGKSESTDTDGVTVAVAVEEEKTEDERLEEEIAARERLFLEKLEEKGLHVFAIEGDGNCLFRAISHQLYLEQDRHDELRARCVEHLIRHRKRFEVFSDGNFDEHLQEMSKQGTWADDLEIRALEEITDRVITIYSSTADTYEPINNNFEEKNLLQGVPPLTLSYHGSSHYNSIYDERYPLPLVERKSRLLLRSRLALTQQDLLPSLSGDAESPRHSTHSHKYAHSLNVSSSSSQVQYTGYQQEYDLYSHASSNSQQNPPLVPVSAVHGYPPHPHEAQAYGQPPQGYAYPAPAGYVDQHGQFVETDPSFANASNMDYYYEQQQQQQPYEHGYDPNMYEPAYEGEYAPEYEEYHPSDYLPAEQQQVVHPNGYVYATPNNGYAAHPHHQQHQQHQQHLPAYNYGYSHGY
eukprot:gene19583-22267_t